MKNAQALIGTTIEVGCVVTPKGRVKAAAIGGAVGEVAGALGRAAAEAKAGGAETASFAGAKLGYLAVTAQEVVLLSAKAAMVGQKATGVLARAPRAALVGVTMGSGTVAKPLQVTFADGTAWELEVPRIQAKGAEALLAVVG